MAKLPLPPILIDPRVGSVDLLPVLQLLDVPCELHPLEFGDVAFAGNGADGPVAIGIERKRIRDLVNSLMSARLTGHQLPGIVGQYQYAWLLVEGEWRTHSQTGLIEVPRRGGQYFPVEPHITGEQLEGWLLTLELRGGLRVRLTQGQRETGLFLQALHRWWCNKEWADHRSHLALYEPPDASILVRPSIVKRVAALLPGIGQVTADAVDKHFDTVVALACAGASEWQKIPGIGKTIAHRAVQTLQEPEDHKP